ncbi:hypothetical protein SAMN04515620_102147 [Collimonas sp. OK607]|uniref:hypothetical protein n=1 Tax=Collimonas sp. OK607 TaxID=1798194 RepID=UPI0008E0F3F5|nr:hypothetical protein [Collimonas sp. OK607]SFA75563.1 hypothetical protein SAMN04515620_102147 [Collimonas sp. OK607]
MIRINRVDGLEFLRFEDSDVFESGSGAIRLHHVATDSNYAYTNSNNGTSPIPLAKKSFTRTAS